MSSRSYADVPNRVVNLFLQEAGAQYDVARGLLPYRKMVAPVLDWFGGVCAYCDAPWEVEEHLVPRNRRSAGLHAWGNVVPACRPCNRAKSGKPWRAFLAERHSLLGTETQDAFTARNDRIQGFIDHHGYAPRSDALIPLLDDLYVRADQQARALVQTALTAAVVELGALSQADLMRDGAAT